MIPLADFNISLDESVSLLRDIKLFKGKGVKPTGTHSEESKKIAKTNRHIDIYSTAIENKDYEILLFDDSIFQFSINKTSLRYNFLQNPNVFSSKNDFLEKILGADTLLTLSEEQHNEYLEMINEEEYEQFLNEQELNMSANAIRYDLTEIGYEPLLHSYSHIHVGMNPSFRIPCSKILTPLKFVFFAIKHTYYRDWKSALETHSNFKHRIRDSKNRCASILSKYWTSEEIFELYLT